MTRSIFLAGNESALCRAIEAEISNRVEKYAVSLIPNRLSARGFANHLKNADPSIGPQSEGSGTAENEKRHVLDWNPSSPISARTLVLAAENRLERIDEAILVCSPPSIRSSASGIPLSDIEIMINDHIKGWFYLVKELASVFTLHSNDSKSSAVSAGTATAASAAQKKVSSLILVYNDISSASIKDDAADVLGPAALASFKALTAGLLASAHNEKYITVAFSSSDAGGEDAHPAGAFASFIFKNIDDISTRSNGKLYKHARFKLF